MPAELAPALKTGFEIEPNDPPEIVTLPGDQGYAMVSPGQVVPAAPGAARAACATRSPTTGSNSKATERARAVAAQIEAKVEKGMPLAQAMKESGAPLPPVQPVAARRIQIAMAQGRCPPALKMLFTLGEGKSRMSAGPAGPRLLHRQGQQDHAGQCAACSRR